MVKRTEAIEIFMKKRQRYCEREKRAALAIERVEHGFNWALNPSTREALFSLLSTSSILGIG